MGRWGSFTTYNPLMVMNTLGDAYVDYDGAIVESAEYVAAFYESAYADETCPTYRADGATPEDIRSHMAYTETAQRVAEDLYTRDLESTLSDAELHYIHG